MDRITVMMKLSCCLRGYYTLLMCYIGWRVMCLLSAVKFSSTKPALRFKTVEVS